MLFQLPSPIPITVKDPDELQAFFKEYNIIPYYGTDEWTSHNFLDLLTTLTNLSPTFQMVERDLKEYTFGLNVNFVGRTIPGLVADETVALDYNSKVDYANFLTDLGISLTQLRKLSKRIKHHLDVCGNAYLKLRRITVGGTTKYFLSVPHYKHVAYLRSIDPGERFLVISKFMGNEELMIKYKPEVLLATMAGDTIEWTQVDDEERAIIHIKIDSDEDESDYYARPDILSCLTWLYVDYQLGNLNSKIAATDIITKVLLAFEGPDPNAGFLESEVDADGNIGGKMTQFQRNMLTLKKLMTNIGLHPSPTDATTASGSIAGIEYPHGGHAPTPIKLDVNRDVAHQTWQSEEATAVICGTMGWASELIGRRAAKATLGGNLLYDMFTIKDMSTIQPTKNFFQDLWNDLLTQICELEGGQKEFKGYGIEFPDVIGEMIGKLKDAKDNNPATEINDNATATE